MRVRERITVAVKFKGQVRSLCIFPTQMCAFPTLAALICVYRLCWGFVWEEYLISNLAWCADKWSSGRQTLWLGISGGRDEMQSSVDYSDNVWGVLNSHCVFGSCEMFFLQSSYSNFYYERGERWLNHGAVEVDQRPSGGKLVVLGFELTSFWAC